MNSNIECERIYSTEMDDSRKPSTAFGSVIINEERQTRVSAKLFIVLKWSIILFFKILQLSSDLAFKFLTTPFLWVVFEILLGIVSKVFVHVVLGVCTLFITGLTWLQGTDDGLEEEDLEQLEEKVEVNEKDKENEDVKEIDDKI